MTLQHGPKLSPLHIRYTCTMKHILSLASVLFLLVSYIHAQHDSGLDAALNKGNAEDVGVFFASSVDISVPGTEATLSSAEAVRVLSAFFHQNTVKGYNRAHLKAPQDGRAAYSLGDLYTANGTFRIYLYFNDQKKISELRLQKA